MTPIPSIPPQSRRSDRAGRGELMPYETIRYHCDICRTPYSKHAEALRCERTGHVARTVWPSQVRKPPTPAANQAEARP